MMREQLAIVVGPCSQEAVVYRKEIFDMYLGERPAKRKDRYRLSLLRSLFNGDIRNIGQISHHACGLFNTRRELPTVMQSKGIEALFPSRGIILDRQNWTGATAPCCQVGLPTEINNIFQQALSRAIIGKVPYEPAALAALSIEDGADTSESHAVAKPMSLWREDKEQRAVGTARWVASKTFKGSLQIRYMVVRIFE